MIFAIYLGSLSVKGVYQGNKKVFFLRRRYFTSRFEVNLNDSLICFEKYCEAGLKVYVRTGLVHKGWLRTKIRA